MLRIRLSRTGRKNAPSYRIVVLEKTAAVKAGTFKDIIGHYIPTREPKVLEFDNEKIKHWISVGAQPTDTVATLLKNAGMSGMEKYIEERNKKRKPKKSKEEAPVEKTEAAPAEGEVADVKEEAPAPEKAEDKPAEAKEEAPAPEKAEDKPAEAKEEAPAEAKEDVKSESAEKPEKAEKEIAAA